MIITPYDTKACMGYAPSLQKLSDTIKKAYLMGGGFKHVTWDHQSNTAAKVLQPNVTGDIKPFGHPVFVKGISGGENLLVADGRSMYSIDSFDSNPRPKQIMAAAITWQEVRLQLQLLWQSHSQPYVQSILDYPTMLYGKVYSEALARKYGLQPDAIARCDMLLVYAFWCFSHEEKDLEKAGKDQLGHLLATMIRSHAPNITSVISNLEYFHSLSDLVEALKDPDVVGTERMGSITVATLHEISRATWYLDAGAPAQEIAACGLEHAPTWMACVFLSTSNASMKNHLAVVSQRYKKLANPDQFVNSVIHLLGNE